VKRLIKSVSVRGPNGREVPARALLDTGAPFNVMPVEIARRAGVPLSGPSQSAVLAGVKFNYVTRSACVTIVDGRFGSPDVFCVADRPWNEEFGEHLLLGSLFLQKVKAKIDYSRRVLSRSSGEIEHPVTRGRGRNPHDAAVTPSYEELPSSPYPLGEPDLWECPWCRQAVRLTSRGAMRRHAQRGSRRACQGSGARLMDE
jgi:hypothetical protein